MLKQRHFKGIFVVISLVLFASVLLLDTFAFSFGSFFAIPITGMFSLQINDSSIDNASLIDNNASNNNHNSINNDSSEYAPFNYTDNNNNYTNYDGNNSLNTSLNENYTNENSTYQNESNQSQVDTNSSSNAEVSDADAPIFEEQNATVVQDTNESSSPFSMADSPFVIAGISVLTNPSFEDVIGTEWIYSETNSGFSNEGRKTPSNFAPTNGSFAYVLGNDTSNGAQRSINAVSGDYAQITQQNVNLTNVGQILFDTKYEARDTYPTSYYNISIYINDTQIWNRVNQDYTNNDTSINITSYGFVELHNLTFRLTVLLTSASINEPGWFIDDVRTTSQTPNVSTPVITPIPPYTDSLITANTTYIDSELDAGTVYFQWFVNGLSVHNQTNSSVSNGTTILNNINTTLFNDNDVINVTVYANDGEQNTATKTSTSVLVRNVSMLVLNPSFETNLSGLEWRYIETDADWSNGIRLDPVNFAPTDGTFAYMLGEDTSNGQGNGRSLTSGTYSQATQENVNLTNVQRILFDTKYIDYYAVTTYFNISVYINGTQIWNRVSQDYTNNDTSINITSYGFVGLHNLSLRLTVGITSSISVPAWFIDNIRLHSIPTHATPVLNATTASNSTADNLTAYNQSTRDQESNSVKNIINWIVNGTSITVLNMPFENNVANVASATKDYSGRGANGTVSGATWSSTGGYELKGAYDFDGVNDFINISAPLGVTPIGTGSYSIEVWAKARGLTHANTVSGAGIIRSFDTGSGSTGGDFALSVDRFGAVHFFNWRNTGADTDGVSFTANNSMNVSTWHHLVAVWNGTGNQIYINGTEVSIVGTETTGTGWGAAHEIGRIFTTSAYWWNGSIDEVRVYNRSLTAQQINALYNNRTDLIVSQETGVDDVWNATITPNDGLGDGPALTSNGVTIAAAAPTHTTPVLNATSSNNLTTDNLTVYNQSTSDADGDVVKNIINWQVNGTSIAVLNLPFEGGSNGTFTKDYSGNSNHGNVTGASFNSTGGYELKGAYDFVNTANNITVPYSESLNITSALTISTWIKPYTGGNVGIVDKTITGLTNKQYQLFAENSQPFLRVVKSGTSYTVKSPTSFSNNVWTHIAARYNGSGLSIWVNGVERNSTAGPSSLDGGNGLLIIGGLGSGIYDFNGTIDEVMIFNRSLSNEQINALYNNRTDLIVSQETGVGDVWNATITPNDGTSDGTALTSNGVTIKALPTFSGTYPNITFAEDTFPEGNTSILTVATFNVSAYFNDTDGDALTFGINTTASNLTNLTAILNSSGILHLNASGNYTTISTGSSIVGQNYIVFFANDGATNTSPSNTVYINITPVNDAPSHTTPVLNATSANNLTSDNLTVFNKSTSDVDGNSVKNIINWQVNGTSITVLNLPFEGGSNATFAKDYSGNSNHGNATGASFNSTGGYDGKGAYVFDGTSALIRLLNSNSLNITKDMSIVAWIKSGNATSGKHILGAYNQAAPYNGYGFAIQDANGALRYWSGTYGSWVIATINVTDSKWHHVVVSVNSSNATFYVDGVRDVVRTSTVPDLYNGVKDIGSVSNSVSTRWDGTIDEVMIFNRSLSAEQINALYNNRTDLIVSQETGKGDVWNATITPNDGTTDGTALTSNGVTILSTVPAFSGTYPNITFAEDTFPEGNTSILTVATFNVSTYFNDTDGDALTFGINTTASNLTNLTAVINSSGILHLNASGNYTTISNGIIGLNYIVFFANDGATNTSPSNVVYINITPVNDAPYFTGTYPNITFAEDSSNTTILTHVNFNMTTYFKELDNSDTITFGINTTMSNLTNITAVINSSGILSINASGNFTGAGNNITFFANDGTVNSSPSNTVYINITPVDDVPTIPGLDLLENLTNTTDSTPFFNWTNSTDIDLDAITYEIQLANESSFSDALVQVNGTLVINNFTASTLINGTYFWRTKAITSSANTSYSGTRNFILDADVPVVLLMSPSNNTGDTDGNITFSYNVSDFLGLKNCTLLINNATNQTNSTITKNTKQNITVTNLAIGNYNWTTQCIDGFNNTGGTNTRQFTVTRMTKYTGATTDLSTVGDISNITNFVIENTSAGKINFSVSVNLSGGVDVDSYVTIQNNHVEVDSTNLPALNKAARISIFNLTLENPEPLKDNVLCSACTEVSYLNGVFVFDATSFSVYSAGETSTARATTSSTTSSGGGGSGGGGVILEAECKSNSDCESGEYCSDYQCIEKECEKDLECGYKGYCQDYQCYSFECGSDSECRSDESCVDNICVTLFDIKVIRADSPVEPGEEFDFTYLMKGMGEINGDVIIKFWLDQDRKRIATGSDTIYLGSYQEKIETASIFVPEDAPTGNYEFYVEITFGRYTAKAHRSIQVGRAVPISLDIHLDKLHQINSMEPFNLSWQFSFNKDRTIPLILNEKIKRGEEVVWSREKNMDVNKSVSMTEQINGLKAGYYVIELTADYGDGEPTIFRESLTVNPTIKDYELYLTPALIALSAIILLSIFIFERRKIKEGIVQEAIWIKKHKFTTLSLVIVVLISVAAYVLNLYGYITLPQKEFLFDLAFQFLNNSLSDISTYLSITHPYFYYIISGLGILLILISYGIIALVRRYLHNKKLENINRQSKEKQGKEKQDKEKLEKSSKKESASKALASKERPFVRNSLRSFFYNLWKNSWKMILILLSILIIIAGITAVLFYFKIISIEKIYYIWNLIWNLILSNISGFLEHLQPLTAPIFWAVIKWLSEYYVYLIIGIVVLGLATFSYVKKEQIKKIEDAILKDIMAHKMRYMLIMILLIAAAAIFYLFYSNLLSVVQMQNIWSDLIPQLYVQLSSQVYDIFNLIISWTTFYYKYVLGGVVILSVITMGIILMKKSNIKKSNKQ